MSGQGPHSLLAPQNRHAGTWLSPSRVLEIFLSVGGLFAFAFYVSVVSELSFWVVLFGLTGLLVIGLFCAWFPPQRTKFQVALFALLLLAAWTYGVSVLHAYLTNAKVDTIAGSGKLGDKDGPALEATFYMPYGIKVVGNDLYVAEHWGQRVRRIRDKYVETLVLEPSVKRTNEEPFQVKWLLPEKEENPESPVLIKWLANLWKRRKSPEPPPPLPPLGFPTGIAAGTQGELYIADFKYHKIWVVEKAANHSQETSQKKLVLRTLVGSGGPGPLPPKADGIPQTQDLDKAKLDTPEDIWVDTENNKLYVLEQGNKCIREVDLNQKKVFCYAGPSNCIRGLDLLDPGGFAYDQSNQTFYVADSGAHVIWELPKSGQSTKIGSGTSGYKDGKDDEYREAQFDYPADVAVEPGSGVLYVTDSGNRCVRRIDTMQRIVETIAGGPEAPGYKDGPGRFARFQAPWNLDIDLKHKPNTLYLTDFEGQRIRRIVLR